MLAPVSKIILKLGFLMTFTLATEESNEKKILLFPNESSVKLFQNKRTNSISWDDPENLVTEKKKETIESALHEEGEKMCSTLFDCISDWMPPVAACPLVQEQLCVISKSVDVTKRGIYNETPLMLAACFNADQAVLNLIQRGAKTDDIDASENTALHWASADKNESSVLRLLQNGANVNATNKYRETSLMLAAREDNEEVVNILLDHDANTKMKSKYGETARECARGKCAYIIEKHENKLKIEKKVSHRPKCCFCCPKLFLRRERRKVYPKGQTVQLKV